MKKVLGKVNESIQYHVTTCPLCNTEYVFTEDEVTYGTFSGNAKIICPNCNKQYRLQASALCDENGDNRHLLIIWQ